jgi:hypothetical protein
MADIERARPAPLPQKLEDYDKLRKKPRFVNLNDLVEELHRELWDDNAEYRRLNEAVWDADAVEGDLGIDDMKAAEMIRNVARKRDAEGEVGRRNLATLVKCLRVVMRRSNADRRSRRYSVSGETVTAENGGNHEDRA